MGRGFRFFLLTAAASSAALAQHRAAETAAQLIAADLDPGRCFHVHDLHVREGDATFYLTDGYLIFGKPVNGAPASAVFSAETEGGDGEVVLLPPDRAERKSLGAAAGSPNLDEHFTQAVFLFTDPEARAIADRLASDASTERDPTRGLLMATKWAATVTGLMNSFASRMTLDLLAGNPTAGSFFEAVLRGRTLGDFDVIYDARSIEQMVVGRTTVKDGGPAWETWTRFSAKSAGTVSGGAPEETILSYRIEASMDASLSMRCTTRMRIRIAQASTHVLPFDLASEMRAVSARIDGESAEVFERDSLRDSLVRDSGNELVLVVPAHELAPGTEHDLEIVHEGKVVRDTGNRVYFVSARGTWYPGRGFQYADYDAIFHYPENLDLVSAGDLKETHVEAGVRTTERVSTGKLRLLGLNLGKYDASHSEKNGIVIDVYANPEFENSIRPASPPMVMNPSPSPTTRALPTPRLTASPAPVPQPSDKIAAIQREVQDAIAFFRARFGDPPLKTISVSPVPGRFGQGFAGMIYLPTFVYLDPEILARKGPDLADEAFLAELLQVHEVAHQWWGNIVAAGSYRHEWLMESLANYSALLYLESRLGPKALDRALDYYKAELLLKVDGGATTESVGPVVSGRRIEETSTYRASNAILYGKGTWILHMLRRRLGDSAFLKMLAELRRRYELKTITTEDFRMLCAEFMPKDAPDPKLLDFFDQWVYDTGIPTLKLTTATAANGRKMTVKVEQSDVRKDFSTLVPIEIRGSGPKPILKTIETADEPVSFSLNLPAPIPGKASAVKATLDPGRSVLRR